MDDRTQFERSDLPRGSDRNDQITAYTSTDTSIDHVRQPYNQQIVDQIQSAAFSDLNPDLSGLINGYLATGITSTDLCETYIPEAARRLGAQWCDDTLSFAGVTIGCARLAKALRDLEGREVSQEPLNAPQVLLLVAEDVYHTLGATVLSGILRRAGLGVQLWIGATASTVKDQLRHTDFDAVLLSASTGESLESLRRLIAAVKLEQPGLPTIVGGTIIDTIGSGIDVAQLTGADVVTTDINRAIRLCHTAAQSAVPFEHKRPSPTNNVTRLQV